MLGVTPEPSISCHMDVQLGPVWEAGNNTYASSVSMVCELDLLCW